MATDTLEHNKQLVRDIYENCINRGNLEPFGELVADDFVDQTGGRGPSAFRSNVEGLRAGFPDIRFAIRDLFAEGDRVAVRWTWEGTHQGTFRAFPPSGKRIENSGTVIYQILDGKIVRAWIETDRLGFLEQLGVVPSFSQRAAGSPSVSKE